MEKMMRVLLILLFFNEVGLVLAQTAPTVYTMEPYDIAPGAAKISAIVLTDGGSAVTQRGVCWSTQPNPTTSTMTKTVNGMGTGYFTASLVFSSSIPQGSIIYLRAYAINSKGTAYGAQTSFELPTTVTIGAQTWFKKNLNVTRYLNGDSLTTEIARTGTAGNTYGPLYTWYAVTDPRGLCPTGWRVPRLADFQRMFDYLGGTAKAGNKMKSTSTLWEWNTAATNSSGFSALPGGFEVPGFVGPQNVGSCCSLWTTDVYDNISGREIELHSSLEMAWINSFDKLAKQSVRCIKN